MQERQWTAGEDLFVESFSPESAYGVVFEDDGDAAYFYAVEKDKEGAGLRVLDALHINEKDEDAPAVGPSKLLIVWSKDWSKCALVIAGLCHAIFDFSEQAGYNINEFPPPNEFWTKGDRKITMERLRNF